AGSAATMPRNGIPNDLLVPILRSEGRKDLPDALARERSHAGGCGRLGTLGVCLSDRGVQLVRAAARRGSSRSIFSAAMAIRFMVSALVFTLAMVEGLHLDSPVRRHDREVADCSRVDPADSLRGGKVGRRSARLAQPPLADKNAPSGSDAFEDTEPFLVA